MPAAARPEPTEAKAALRPRRALIPLRPTRPRLIAAIAGPSTQLAPACKIREAKTTTKIGDIASANALIPTAATAAAATQRCERAASTIAPPGI